MAAFQERLRALQRDWRAQLPQRLQEAREQLAACRAAPQDAHALQVLHRMLHTLAGSAGSFGEPELGRQAREIEHGLQRLLALPQRQCGDYDAAQRALDALRAHAAGG
jgi:chemotaxis protein histidine kinase CheA